MTIFDDLIGLVDLLTYYNKSEDGNKSWIRTREWG